MIIAEISNGRVITLIKMMNCLKNIYIYIYKSPFGKNYC